MIISTRSRVITTFRTPNTILFRLKHIFSQKTPLNSTNTIKINFLANKQTNDGKCQFSAGLPVCACAILDWPSRGNQFGH